MSTEQETRGDSKAAGSGAASPADEAHGESVGDSTAQAAAAGNEAIVDQTETAAGASDRAPTSSDDWALVQGELRQLRSELAEARAARDSVQEQADRYHANWQRSAADFLNWKRRADQEKADASKLGEAAVISDLLRVLDDFERAFVALPSELRRLTWIEGVHMIWGKLFTIFESRGLTPIEALGRDFDPREHEAVMREDDADPSEQTAVVAELQRGYRFHDRVIRPTLVKVGRPKAPAGEASGSEAVTSQTSAPETSGDQATTGDSAGVGAAPDTSESAPTVG